MNESAKKNGSLKTDFLDIQYQKNGSKIYNFQWFKNGLFGHTVQKKLLQNIYFSMVYRRKAAEKICQPCSRRQTGIFPEIWEQPRGTYIG